MGDSGKVYITTNGGGPVGLENLEHRNELIIFPNPLITSTTIEFQNKNNEKHTLIIYNSTGQLVRKIEHITTGSVIIERENLKNGLYFFQLMNDHQSVGEGKLIVNQ